MQWLQLAMTKVNTNNKVVFDLHWVTLTCGLMATVLDIVDAPHFHQQS